MRRLGMLSFVVHVTRGGADDLEQLLQIAAAHREQYAGYSPQFWRPATDAVDRQREYFTSLLTDDQAVMVVAREGRSVRGFATARTVPAPPVYDPGGPSCAVDDFAVAEVADWPSVGPLLLGALRSWGASRGATQMVVVTAHLDQAKRAELQAFGLTLASEWWVGQRSDEGS